MPAAEYSASEVARKIRRKLGSLAAVRLGEIMRDWERMTAEGVRSGDDLAALTLDRSIAPEVRQTSCWFMGRIVPRRLAGPALIHLAADRGEPTLLRCEALHSLGLIRFRPSLPILEDLALHERDLDVRESSIYALGFFSNQRALRVLLSIARDERETPRVRGEAIEQIGMVGITTDDVLRALTALVGHQEADISFWAAYSLGQIGDESVIPALAEAAQAEGRELPPFGTVREEATRAIESIHSRSG